MELEKFTLPVEIVDLISTLEPEYQAIIYPQLFDYIYHGNVVSDDIDSRCRLILTLIIEKIDALIERARKAQQRKDARIEAKIEAEARAIAEETPYDYNAPSDVNDHLYRFESCGDIFPMLFDPRHVAGRLVPIEEADTGKTRWLNHIDKKYLLPIRSQD